MTKNHSPSLIKHPISLVAYVIGLVFTGLASQNIGNWPWWPAVAASLALVSVIGGLWLAHLQIKPSTNTKQPTPKNTSARQETHGPDSPIINDVGGDVSLNYGSPQKGKKSGG
jgi:hypothetical protein